MFVLMHGEGSADIGQVYDKPELFVCSEDVYALSNEVPSVFHCETKSLDCALVVVGVSFVKKGMFN